MLAIPSAPISRRSLLVGAAALAASALPAAAKAPMLTTAAPGFYRFRIGAFEATAISDGPLVMGPPQSNVFKGLSREDFVKALEDNFLPSDSVRMAQNALVVNTGSHLVLFDTGVGGFQLMGPLAGRLLVNLKAAGIAPEDIDAVVLTHAHPDHCWALMTEDGRRNFPNAQIYLSQADFEFWTDESKRSLPMIGAFIAPTRQQLLPSRERIVFVTDGAEVVPGIQAIATPGHTVGHMSYMIASGQQALCCTGDIVHHHVISLQTPRLQFAYDTDGPQGVTSRMRVLDMLAARRIPLIGYHFPWPGLGHVAKRGEAYRYFAVALQTAL